MFLFRNNKGKAEIKILEFSKTLDYRQYGVEYTEDITAYIDNADNYMIIGSAQISKAGVPRNKYYNKWVPAYLGETVSSSYLTEVEDYPALMLYNDGSSVKLYFKLYNAVDVRGTVKFRVALMRVADVISA